MDKPIWSNGVDKINHHGDNTFRKKCDLRQWMPNLIAFVSFPFCKNRRYKTKIRWFWEDTTDSVRNCGFYQFQICCHYNCFFLDSYILISRDYNIYYDLYYIIYIIILDYWCVLESKWLSCTPFMPCWFICAFCLVPKVQFLLVMFN